MKLLILIILAIAIVVVIYELIHRFMIKRAILIVQRQAQEQTDRVVALACQQLFGEDLLTSSSKLVADVWGKGVLSFEYSLDLQKHDITDKLDRKTFSKAIDQAASDQQIIGFNGASQPFLVTDWWQFEHVFHVDVTYLMNEATVEYVHDLHKLND